MTLKDIAGKIKERIELFDVEDFTLKNGKKVKIYKCGVMYILKYSEFYKAYARAEDLAKELLELSKN